jgi:ATP-dependent DNA ligase
MRISPDGTTRLTSRNNNGFSARFPKLAGALGDTLGGRAAVLDGEIVALNELGQPDFGLLQNRAAAAAPVSYFVFDVLQLGDVQLLDEPYDRRREVLEAAQAARQEPRRDHPRLQPRRPLRRRVDARVGEQLAHLLVSLVEHRHGQVRNRARLTSARREL